MNTSRRSLLRALAATALPVFAGEPVVQRDVPYAGTVHPQQTLDLFAPADAKKCPVVIWIHGGGWASGDKTDDMQTKPRAFTEKGYVFVSVNYRLLFLPAEHPGTAQTAVRVRDIGTDLAKAVRWLHENVARFGGDPEFFFLAGHSAGAQLAALLCTDERYLKAEGLGLNLLKGCIPVDGDTYYPALQIDTATPGLAAAWRRKFPDSENQRDLSSVMHVARNKAIPPFLILHVAEFPETGTKIQSQILEKSLHEAGVPVKVFPADGRTHITLNTYLGLPDDPATRVVFEFIEEQIWRANYASWAPPGP